MTAIDGRTVMDGDNRKEDDGRFRFGSSVRQGSPTLTIVTLGWRNARFAAAFVETLSLAASQAKTTVTLVAVQNGPEGDEASQLLRNAVSRHSEVLNLIDVVLPSNAGYAGGANAGIKIAQTDVVVVANLDIQFDRAAVVNLLEFFANSGGNSIPVPAVFPLSGKMEFRPSGPARHTFLHLTRGFKKEPLPGMVVPLSNGCFIAATSATWRERQLSRGEYFPSHFHSYAEDMDFFWWARKSEHPLVYCPKIVIWHQHGGSSGGLISFKSHTRSLRIQIVSNWRMTVLRNSQGLKDRLGWVLAEFAQFCRFMITDPTTGIQDYASSWRRTASFLDKKH
jgi:GT2 family glycosyltransferase